MRQFSIFYILSFKFKMVMQQPFEFGAPSPLIDDHEFALAFDFNTPVTINPRALRLDTTPAPIQPSHSALIRPLSAPVASGSGSQHREFVSDVDDSYIPPLPPLESYYDPGPGYLAPYHPLPNQISSFFPEFAEPELSISNDALLPVGADFHDESRRKEIYETGAALTQKISGKRNRKSRLAKQPWHDSESDGFQMEHFERQPPKRAKVVSHCNLPSIHESLIADVFSGSSIVITVCARKLWIHDSRALPARCFAPSFYTPGLGPIYGFLPSCCFASSVCTPRLGPIHDSFPACRHSRQSRAPIQPREPQTQKNCYVCHEISQDTCD
jgi:hypothetical protein